MVESTPKKTITFEVPDGMTPEQLQNLVTAYIPKREKSKARGKARRKAVETLVKKYEPEYKQLLAKFRKQFGVTES